MEGVVDVVIHGRGRRPSRGGMTGAKKLTSQEQKIPNQEGRSNTMDAVAGEAINL